MTRRRPDKRRARQLQEQTGWRYQHCLNLVRAHTEDEIDDIIEKRAIADLEKGKTDEPHGPD